MPSPQNFRRLCLDVVVRFGTFIAPEETSSQAGTSRSILTAQSLLNVVLRSPSDLIEPARLRARPHRAGGSQRPGTQEIIHAWVRHTPAYANGAWPTVTCSLAQTGKSTGTGMTIPQSCTPTCITCCEAIMILPPERSLHTSRRPAMWLRMRRVLRTLDSLPVPGSGGGR